MFSLRNTTKPMKNVVELFLHSWKDIHNLSSEKIKLIKTRNSMLLFSYTQRERSGKIDTT